MYPHAASPAVSPRSLQPDASPRPIVLRTRGHAHGAITRLISPHDVGALTKPFVFLDYFEGAPAEAPSFGFHPHSGIATLTLILSGQVTYKETTDRAGVIDTGGVEWMRASSGVWHTGGAAGTDRIRASSLGGAAAGLELAEPEGQYLDAAAFPAVGPARIIAGDYDGAKPVTPPAGLTYLDVRLRAGQRWVYQPPAHHDVAWIAAHQGTIATAEAVSAGELVVFGESDQPITFEAATDAGFVLGSAVKHPFDLVTGHYSVHTTEEALRRGESNIAAIGRRLHNQGVLGPNTRVVARSASQSVGAKLDA